MMKRKKFKSKFGFLEDAIEFKIEKYIDFIAWRFPDNRASYSREDLSQDLWVVAFTQLRKCEDGGIKPAQRILQLAMKKFLAQKVQKLERERIFCTKLKAFKEMILRQKRGRVGVGMSEMITKKSEKNTYL